MSVCTASQSSRRIRPRHPRCSNYPVPTNMEAGQSRDAPSSGGIITVGRYIRGQYPLSYIRACATCRHVSTVLNYAIAPVGSRKRGPLRRR